MVPQGWEQTTPPVALFTNMLLSVFAPFSQNGQRSTNEACPELYVSLAPSRPARGANLPLRHSAHAAGASRASDVRSERVGLVEMRGEAE